MSVLRRCLYPGSFDPVTVGHMDLIERAAGLWDEVIVAVLRNPAKKGCFTLEERLELLQACCAHLPNVRVSHFEGLTVAFAKELGAQAMLRGLRAAGDFESERALAQLNQMIAPEIETVILLGRPEHAAISSSAVRELGSFGGDISALVPACIEQRIKQHFKPTAV